MANEASRCSTVRSPFTIGAGEYGTFLDPDVLHFINWIFFFLSLLVAVSILFPSFISLRSDNRVSWNWSVVFIPAFIVDLVLLVLLKPGKPDNDDQEKQGKMVSFIH